MGEQARLRAVRASGLLDTPAEQAFDDIAQLASILCGTAAATVTLIDRERQWFKASVGMGVRETPLAESICAIAIRNPDDMLEIRDVHARQDLPMRPRDAQGRQLQFYAGVPVHAPGGHALGTVCVLDHAPRTLTDPQRTALRALGRQVERLLELRSLAREHSRDAQQLERARDDLQRRHDDLKKRASHDPLTGLLNRAALQQLRHQEDALARLRAGGYVLAVVDIDHFKQVNDRHGHLLGDRALKTVAEILAQSIRGSDVAVRYGGEEFLLILPSTSLADAFTVAERVRLAVMRTELPFPLTVSIGLAAGDARRDTPEQVFERADQALYRAKARGRNRSVADETPRV